MTSSQHDLSRARWRKSTHSGDANTCVEAAPLPGVIAVRDSKNPAGPALLFDPAVWASFTSSVKNS